MLNPKWYGTPGYSKRDKCPNCGRAYSRDERCDMGPHVDDEYCCDMCKREAESVPGLLPPISATDSSDEHREEGT